MRHLIKLFVFSLTFTISGEIFAQNPSPEDAARGVLERLIPERSDRFVLKTIPKDNGRDVFEIESKAGRIVLRGSNGVSICSALNWYLKYYCHADVSWSGVQLNLPDPLPRVAKKIRRVSPHRYRYFFNYCCFGYSLPWWDWDQWEFIIDWMALNGINMPLSVTGQEAVWQSVMRELGLKDESIRDFLAGPPYLPFGWMGCLDGWGGPISQDWIDRHAEMQKKILARERSLGMTPVLQGFTGHVPKAIANQFPDTKLHRIEWIEWNTLFIDPLDPLFRRVGKTFVEHQTRLFGTDHLYAADTFIEMSPPSSDPQFLTDMGKSLSGTMTAADPDALWIMQGWIFFNNAKFWKPPQSKAFLGGVPDDRMFLLDLFCDVAPVWKKTESFYGKPWIWCILQNFGNTVSLSGPLERINSELHSARNDPNRGKLSGIGMIQEGLGYNPVVFDFMLESTWRDAPVDLDEWIRNYAHRRYGQQIPQAEKAWSILKESVYNETHRPNSIITTRPSEKAGGTLSIPRLDRLTQAWDQLLQCGDALGKTETYRFDLINVTRQTLSDLARLKYTRAIKAYQNKDRTQLASTSREFLQLLSDLDKALATRTEFLLGRWLEDAKRWGNNGQEKRTYEWNARNVITLWGDAKSRLHDYAKKEWSGLISGFYLKRWTMFFERLDRALAEDKTFDAEAFTRDIQAWEESWTRQTEPYPAEPRGDSVSVSRQLFKQYGKAHKEGNESHSAHREHDSSDKPNRSKKLAALVPKEWTLYDNKVLRFTAKSLYEHINGRAEFFLAFDAIDLTFASYEKAGVKNTSINVSVYDMASPANAFGVYSGERSDDALPLDLGRAAYRSGANYYFWKGQYYIQIVASNETEALQRTGLDLARQLADFLPDSGAAVWGLSAMPREGLVPDSVQFYLVDAFGLGFLKNTYTAQYRKGDSDVTVFLSRCDTDQSARSTVTRYSKFAERYGKSAERVTVDGVELLLCDMGSNYDAVFQKGRLIGGVAAEKDRTRTIQAAADLSKQLQTE